MKKDAVRAELDEAVKTYRASRRAWTAAEDAILDEYYDRVPVQILAEKLNRTVAAVRWRADAKRRGDI